MYGDLMLHIMTTLGHLTVPADGCLLMQDGFGHLHIIGVGRHIITADGNIPNFTDGSGFRAEYGLQIGVCGEIMEIMLAGTLAEQGYTGMTGIMYATITGLLKQIHATG